MRFFEMLTRLLQVYPLFSNLFTVFQEVIQDPVMGAFGMSKLTGLPPREYIVLEKRQKSVNYFGVYALVDLIPGSDCGQFGYKIGTIIRLVLKTQLPDEWERVDFFVE